MAQKSRPSSKRSAKAKAGPAKTPAKNKTPTPKAKNKVAAKPASKTKSILPKVAAPPKTAPKSAAKSTAPVAAPAAAKSANKDAAKASSVQIARAKKALEQTSLDAVATAPTPSSNPTPLAKTAKSAKAEKARSRKITIDIGAHEAAGVLVSKWNALFKRAENIDAKPYNMKQQFEERTAIVHKVLGWGYILANRNDRLEVLFKDGIKYLISNYKP